jgi:hypothetical protein
MIVLITENRTRSNCHKLMIRIDKESEQGKWSMYIYFLLFIRVICIKLIL